MAKGLKDSDLLCLLSVKMLHKLKIFKSRISSDCEITFDGGVTPLLIVFGSSLETLALECLDFIPHFQRDRVVPQFECPVHQRRYGIAQQRAGPLLPSR